MKIEASERKGPTIKEICSSSTERIAPSSDSRKVPKAKKRPAVRSSSSSAKIALITTLFNNAKANITRLEEEKVANKPKAGGVHGPTVRLVNGKAVIDTGDLVKAAEIDLTPEGPRRTVIETGNKVTKTKRTHSDRWTMTETDQFYTALQLFGTDFCMISNFLARRSRHQVKSKYKKESKLNPGRIEYATTTKVEVSKEAYQQFTDELKSLVTAFALGGN